jgi:hypothetical protein
MAIRGPDVFQTTRNAEVYGAVLLILAEMIDVEQQRLKETPSEVDSAVVPLLACLAAIVHRHPKSAQIAFWRNPMAVWEVEHENWLNMHLTVIPASRRSMLETHTRSICSYLRDLGPLLPNISESLVEGERGKQAIAGVILELWKRLDTEFDFLKKTPWPTEMGFLGWLAALVASIKLFPTISRSLLTKDKVQEWSHRYFDWFDNVQRRIPANHRIAMREKAQLQFDELCTLITS